MRTADSIAQQGERGGKAQSSEGVSKRGAHLQPYQFQPGQSGNPGGKRKSDTARSIARKIFDNNEEEIYKALGKALLKGNAYVFKELAERAFGKLKETHEFGGLDNIANLLVEGRKRVAARKPTSAVGK